MRPERDFSGTTMTHPVVVLSMVALIVNDHLLKALYPGWLTGKLSDVAGLVLFPILVVSLLEVVSRSPRGRLRFTFVAIALLTGAVFSAVQLTGSGGETYRYVWGALQFWEPSGSRASLTQDPSDLLALPMLGVAAWVYVCGHRRSAAV